MRYLHRLHLRQPGHWPRPDEAIKYGQQKVMLAGGAEGCAPLKRRCSTPSTPPVFATTNQALTPKPCDASRDGLVIGEGAGTLVLESLDHALAMQLHYL